MTQEIYSLKAQKAAKITLSKVDFFFHQQFLILRKISKLSRGSIFGEEELIANCVRKFDAVCDSVQGEVLFVRKAIFFGLVMSDPSTQEMLESKMESYNEVQRQQKNHILSSIHDYNKYLLGKAYMHAPNSRDKQDTLDIAKSRSNTVTKKAQSKADDIKIAIETTPLNDLLRFNAQARQFNQYAFDPTEERFRQPELINSSSSSTCGDRKAKSPTLLNAFSINNAYDLDLIKARVLKSRFHGRPQTEKRIPVQRSQNEEHIVNAKLKEQISPFNEGEIPIQTGSLNKGRQIYQSSKDISQKDDKEMGLIEKKTAVLNIELFELIMKKNQKKFGSHFIRMKELIQHGGKLQEENKKKYLPASVFESDRNTPRSLMPKVSLILQEKSFKNSSTGEGKVFPCTSTHIVSTYPSDQQKSLQRFSSGTSSNRQIIQKSSSPKWKPGCAFSLLARSNSTCQPFANISQRNFTDLEEDLYSPFESTSIATSQTNIQNRQSISNTFAQAVMHHYQKFGNETNRHLKNLKIQSPHNTQFVRQLSGSSQQMDHVQQQDYQRFIAQPISSPPNQDMFNRAQSQSSSQSHSAFTPLNLHKQAYSPSRDCSQEFTPKNHQTSLFTPRNRQPFSSAPKNQSRHLYSQQYLELANHDLQDPQHKSYTFIRGVLKQNPVASLQSLKELVKKETHNKISHFSTFFRDNNSRASINLEQMTPIQHEDLLYKNVSIQQSGTPKQPIDRQNDLIPVNNQFISKQNSLNSRQESLNSCGNLYELKSGTQISRKGTKLSILETVNSREEPETQREEPETQRKEAETQRKEAKTYRGEYKPLIQRTCNQQQESIQENVYGRMQGANKRLYPMYTQSSMNSQGGFLIEDEIDEGDLQIQQEKETNISQKQCNSQQKQLPDSLNNINFKAGQQYLQNNSSNIAQKQVELENTVDQRQRNHCVPLLFMRTEQDFTDTKEVFVPEGNLQINTVPSSNNELSKRCNKRSIIFPIPSNPSKQTNKIISLSEKIATLASKQKSKKQNEIRSFNSKGQKITEINYITERAQTDRKLRKTNEKTRNKMSHQIKSMMDQTKVIDQYKVIKKRNSYTLSSQDSANVGNTISRPTNADFQERLLKRHLISKLRSSDENTVTSFLDRLTSSSDKNTLQQPQFLFSYRSPESIQKKNKTSQSLFSQKHRKNTTNSSNQQLLTEKSHFISDTNKDVLHKQQPRANEFEDLGYNFIRPKKWL